MNSIIKTPAQNLEGITLPCGWEVLEYIPKEIGQSGGNFSIGYRAIKDGKTAFLKALDFKKLMTARGLTDQLTTLNIMTESFVFERDILQQCKEAGMSKIIRSYSQGSFEKDGILVPYLVFEMADGDIRKQTTHQAGFDIAWIMRTMHHVAIGVRQLHSKGISHQDIKPSNILIVDEEDRKIGDFGTCVTKECKLPHTKYDIAGDTTYAPPEALYGYIDPDWTTRRYGNDAYQLGSLLVFMIIGVPLTTLIFQTLKQEYHPNKWTGTYLEVLPYIENAFIQAITLVDSHLPVEDKLKNKIISIIKELCEPSILKRGDPVSKRNKSNPFNMERYISRLDFISKSLEYKLF